VYPVRFMVRGNMNDQLFKHKLAGNLLSRYFIRTAAL